MTPYQLPATLPVKDAELFLDAGGIDIWLDGELIDNVISYDIPGQTLRRYATDNKGYFIAEGDQARIETVSGEIKVALRQDWPKCPST